MHVFFSKLRSPRVLPHVTRTQAPWIGSVYSCNIQLLISSIGFSSTADGIFVLQYAVFERTTRTYDHAYVAPHLCFFSIWTFHFQFGFFKIRLFQFCMFIFKYIFLNIANSLAFPTFFPNFKIQLKNKISDQLLLGADCFKWVVEGLFSTQFCSKMSIDKGETRLCYFEVSWQQKN